MLSRCVRGWSIHAGGRAGVALASLLLLIATGCSDECSASGECVRTYDVQPGWIFTGIALVLAGVGAILKEWGDRRDVRSEVAARAVGTGEQAATDAEDQVRYDEYVRTGGDRFTMLGPPSGHTHAVRIMDPAALATHVRRHHHKFVWGISSPGYLEGMHDRAHKATLP